mmetsp:Transcript_98110/g.184504  ORF Transcript_98110/g.184504 Transcript_98110/m.184504 type:complete len:629 (-) Transcript_98110:103-1989(-)
MSISKSRAGPAADMDWVVLEEQRRIIEAQRGIIEEQQRIISQHQALKKLTSPGARSPETGCSTASSAGNSSAGSTAGSIRSLPTTVSSKSEVEAVSRRLLDVTVQPGSTVGRIDEALSPAMLDVTMQLDSETRRSVQMGTTAPDQHGLKTKDELEDFLEQVIRKGAAISQRPCLPSVSSADGQQSCSADAASQRRPPLKPSPTEGGSAVANPDSRAVTASQDSEQSWRESFLNIIDQSLGSLNHSAARTSRSKGPTRLTDRSQSPTRRTTRSKSPTRNVQPANWHHSAQEALKAKPGIAPERLPDASREATHSRPAGGVGEGLNREMCRFELDSWVLCANISSDGKWLCAASDDKTARVYSLEKCDNKSLHRRFDHGDWVWTAEFSRDSQSLCTSSSDGCARVFVLETGQERNCLRHAGVVRSASFSPVGDYLCTASNDRTARIFSFEEDCDGFEVSCFEHTGWVVDAGWSPSGQQLCTAADDMTARIFDVKTGSQVQSFLHSDWVRSVKFHPDAKRLCTACDDMVVRIYDTDSRRMLQTFEHSAAVCSASFSPDGNWLCTACSDANAYIYDMGTGKELLRFKHGGRVCSANFSPDGRRLCTASEDGSSRVFGYAMQSILTLVALAAR